MGRKPKIRVSYYADAQFLLRLIHAVEADKTRPLVWREARIRELKALATEFMQAPSSAA